MTAIGGLNLGILTGLGIGLLRRDRELGSDLALSFGFQSYLALAGVTLDVIGEAHLWERRPCVFVMNHQSALDLLIVGALAQKRLSAMGKKEARFLPPTYLLGRAMKTVWVDRSDPEAARASQQELVDRLRSGYSVVVAPEGTRRPTPVLGTFRTGAFHVATEAQVPVVPIVLRNSYDLMPGSAKTSVPGRVQVAVLPPVETTGWSRPSIREHVEEVRRSFVETLADWPEGDA
jgi:putative phosphoserine phosphatase/1-acylglycerol-3-phosphate O-acyltransferase